MLTTIVIPCYNEENRLNQEAFTNYVEMHPEIHFLFVNDGSTDNTLSLLKRLAEQHDQLHYLDLEVNGGKAEAVRQGMLHAANNFNCDYVGFWDADLATPLEEIEHFISQMQRKDFDIVTGLRLMRLGASIKRKSMRHYLGRCFATTASIVLKLPVYDTQCGSKLYKSHIVSTLFNQTFITRWLFDVELLARYNKAFGREQAIQRIYEYPLLYWEDVDGSRVKVKDFFKAPYELWKIKRNYR